MVSEPEFTYALKTREINIIYTLDMPYPLLKKWHIWNSTRLYETESKPDESTRH